jgi:hypothetical protein
MQTILLNVEKELQIQNMIIGPVTLFIQVIGELPTQNKGNVISRHQCVQAITHFVPTIFMYHIFLYLIRQPEFIGLLMC